MDIQNGAFFGDQLVSRNEFIRAVDQQLKNSTTRKQTIAMLSSILQYKDRPKQFKEAYDLWDTFQKTFLLNTIPISLVVASGFTSEGQMLSTATLTQHSDQKNALGTSRYLSKRESINEAARKGFVEVSAAQLQEHFNGLIKTVQEEQLTPEDEYRVMYSRYNEAKENQYNAIRSRFKDPKQRSTYRQVIWGATQNAHFRGQVADAFFNHLGAMHQQLFTGNGIDATELSSIQFTRTVADEERSKSHFFQLLVDSTNSTNWLSGGDINLVDEHRRVIAKIQLKTIGDVNKTAAGALSTTLFFQLINQLLQEMEIGHYEVIGDQLYETLKTSAIVKQVNQSSNTIIEKLKGLLHRK